MPPFTAKHSLLSERTFRGSIGQSQISIVNASTEVDVALLTGCQDRHYAFGLATALASKGVCLEIIGGDQVDSPEFHTTPKLTFLNLRRNQQQVAPGWVKIYRLLAYYGRLCRYALTARPKVFHILWNNRVELIDRTLVMAYYKLLGKKIVLTAHNVNAASRDSQDTCLNRITLRIQYQLADHIFVHTEKMRRDLLTQFSVSSHAVTVIPYGINNAVSQTNLTSAAAKQQLGIRGSDRTILFFGAIAPYKGLEFLVTAFQQLIATNVNYRLIIAGKPKKDNEAYFAAIHQAITRTIGVGRVIEKIEYIRDEDTERYFKAADVLVLPYSRIFQSGILFLAYSFGLPVIATDVGAFRDDVIEAKTGYLCRPCDPADLAQIIDKYFESQLFNALDRRRPEIRDYMTARHSWDVVAEMTRNVYEQLQGSWQ
jgi:glycosyltransferase involved in cell wall biosynthesis